MSTQLQAAVFHPTVSRSLRLWSTTLGREKTYRTIQYFARFYAHILLRIGHTASASKWNNLKSALALGRKLLRFFKPIEHLQLSLTSLSPTTAPAIERYTAFLRQLAYAAYISYDSLVWLSAVRFFDVDSATSQRYNRIGQRFWLAGILLSIAHGTVKLNRHVAAIRDVESSTREKSVVEGERAAELAALEKARVATRYQLIMDLLDIFLPASNLGYVDINDGLAGLIGVTTSLMALRGPWAAAGAAEKK